MHISCRIDIRGPRASNHERARAPQSSNTHVKMPSKKKGPSEQKSKKAIAEAKRIRAADQTFGIKNKGKSAKAKQYVSRVEHSLTGNEKKAQQERKEKLKAKREQREAEEREERALFSETTDVMKVKKKGQSSSVQKADEDLSEEMEKALLRAKELFDAGAMSMQDYQNYREQILAPDSDEEEEDDEDGVSEATAESEPDPRLDMKREDLYLEGADDDIDIDALPDDDGDAE